MQLDVGVVRKPLFLLASGAGYESADPYTGGWLSGNSIEQERLTEVPCIRRPPEAVEPICNLFLSRPIDSVRSEDARNYR